jgi:hypothetical protein
VRIEEVVDARIAEMGREAAAEQERQLAWCCALFGNLDVLLGGYDPVRGHVVADDPERWWLDVGTSDLTFRVEIPCPSCRGTDVYGLLLVDEEGTHAHTQYRCLRFGCEWSGWNIPGWARFRSAS